MRLNVNIPVDGNCARKFLYLLIDTNKNAHVLIQAVGVKEKEAFMFIWKWKPISLLILHSVRG